MVAHRCSGGRRQANEWRASVTRIDDRRCSRRRRSTGYRDAGLCLLACAVGACTSEVELTPIIDLPPVGARAYPWTDLDELELAVTEAGQPQALVAQTFVRGQTIGLTQVPRRDKLVLHLTGRTSGAEVAYGRSCPFSLAEDGALPVVHVYFSRTVSWASRGTTLLARNEGLAVPYPDGSAVFLGGTDASGAALSSLERFVPNTAQVSSVPNLSPRGQTVASVLGDGRVVIAGGMELSSGMAVPFVELVSLSATENPVFRLEEARFAQIGQTLTPVANGQVVAMGGRNPSTNELRERVLALAADGAGVALRELRASMQTPRYHHTATSLAEDAGSLVLVAGGLSADGRTVATAELYKPLRETFVDTNPALYTMRVPRYQHQAVRMPDGSVLIIGGVDANGGAVHTLELFTLDAGFTVAGELPPNAGVIGASVTALPDGRVLIAGGRPARNEAPVDTAFIARLDLLDGTVSLVATDRLATPRANAAATLLCDGTVLLAGGSTADPNALRYNPPSAGRR